MNQSRIEFPATSARSHTLANGLNIILLPDPTVEVVSVQAWIGTGSVHEKQWLGAGMSHLLEHMVFKGTRSFDTAEMAKTVQAAGGQWNAYTSYDRTVYYIDGPANATETFLQVIGEMVFHPAFPTEDFETEKDVIRREIEMGMDEPGRAAHKLLFDTIYRQDSRRHPVIGHREHFDRITHQDMLAYHQSRYTPDNTSFCLVGNFDPDLVIGSLEKLTEGLTAPFAEILELPREPAQLGTRRAEAEFNQPTTKLTLAWRAPGIEHSASPALDLLASLLGRGQSSLLYQKHREGSGKAIEISAWNYSTKGMDGVFAISAECQPEKREGLSAEIREHIASLSVEDFAPHLEKVKRQAITSQFGTLTTASGRASDLAKNWHEASNLDFTRDYLKQLEKVDASDLEAAAAHFLQDQNLTITCLNPLNTPPREGGGNKSSQRGEPELHTLSNGIRVVLIPDDRIPLLALEVAMLGGTAAESAENAGIGTLMASSLMKGTIRRNALEIAHCLEDLGGSITAYSGNNTFGIKAGFLNSDLETAFELTADLLLNASFPADSIEREKQSQLSDLREQLSHPLQLAFNTNRSSIFEGSAYASPRLGTEESLEAIDQDSLKAHLAKLRSPENCVIGIAGSLNPDQTLKLAENYLGGMTGRKSEFSPDKPKPEKQEKHLHLDDKNQAVLCVSIAGLSATDPRRTALDLLDSYLSDMAGPLFTRIREELGLAYYVGASQFAGINSGMLSFYLGTSPEQLELAQSELLSQLEALANEGLDETAFERARNNHMAAISLARQGNRPVAQAAALDTLLGLGHRHHLDAENRIARLSLSEVNAVAKSLLKQPRILTTVTPG